MCHTIVGMQAYSLSMIHVTEGKRRRCRRYKLLLLPFIHNLRVEHVKYKSWFFLLFSLIEGLKKAFSLNLYLLASHFLLLFHSRLTHFHPSILSRDKTEWTNERNGGNGSRNKQRRFHLMYSRIFCCSFRIHFQWTHSPCCIISITICVNY